MFLISYLFFVIITIVILTIVVEKTNNIMRPTTIHIIKNLLFEFKIRNKVTKKDKEAEKEDECELEL